MRPWQTLAKVATREGTLELRQRGEQELLIVIAGRVLMTSVSRRSEEALATLACAPIADRAAPRVLVGGLGMGFTLRAALDALPARAKVTVGEIQPEIVDWCRGPLAGLTGDALADPRVTVAMGDVARLIARSSAGSWDAILLDLYEGPHQATQASEDPFYGPTALERSRAALAQAGVLAVWSEDADPAFAARFAGAGFDVSVHRAGRGGRAHVVYVGRRGAGVAGEGRRRR
jgi:spermidine synthase